MLRKLLSLAILGLCCSMVAMAEDVKKSGEADKATGKFGGFDKAKIFEKMDANSDGKVTKEEYTKSVEAMMERLKDRLPAGKGGNAAEFAAKRFDSMDADKDGSVTKAEFEKDSGFGRAAGGIRGKGEGLPGKRPGTPPVKD